MSEDKVYRQERKRISPAEFMQPEPQSDSSAVSLNDVLAVQRQAGMPVAKEAAALPQSPKAPAVSVKPMEGVQITGNIPPALQNMLQQRIADVESGTDIAPPQNQAPSMAPAMRPASLQMTQPMNIRTNDPALTALLGMLHTQNYEKVMLPSLGKFYADPDQPSGGEVHIRPMTGQEESILTTQRLLRNGRGMDMIFHNCLLEQHINPEKLLTEDRTFLLIYLRAISYGHLYEVSVKCPQCDHNFAYDINLNLDVDYCSEDLTRDSLQRTLPRSGFTFKYRFPTGADENDISQYRERKTRFSNATDDTFFYRASLLITEMKHNDIVLNNNFGIQTLLERLPAADVNFIRNTLNKPPFGVNTKIDILCPNCTSEFPINLPFELNFFFPEEPTPTQQ